MGDNPGENCSFKGLEERTRHLKILYPAKLPLRDQGGGKTFRRKVSVHRPGLQEHPAARQPARGQEETLQAERWTHSFKFTNYV